MTLPIELQSASNTDTQPGTIIELQPLTLTELGRFGSAVHPPSESCRTAANALLPTAGSTATSPSASIPSSSPGLAAAIPTSAHGPHCTLAHRSPPARRSPHIPSSHPFAKQ